MFYEVSGILEKLSFNASCDVSGILHDKSVKGYMAADCVLGNWVALLIAFSIISLLLAVWISKTPQDAFAYEAVDSEVSHLLPPSAKPHV